MLARIAEKPFFGCENAFTSIPAQHKTTLQHTLPAQPDAENFELLADLGPAEESTHPKQSAATSLKKQTDQHHRQLPINHTSHIYKKSVTMENNGHAN